MDKIKNEVYDLSLVIHWKDDKDSWLGVNDINKSTLKEILKEVNHIFPDCLDNLKKQSEVK